MDTTKTSRDIRRSMRRQTVGGLVAVAALFGGFGVWAATTSLSGAVIAAGQVVVETNVKKVQHPTGGVVGEIRVRDGDRVTSGDLLLRLDETVTRANLSMIAKQLDQFEARNARLTAERDGLPEIKFPASLVERRDQADVADALVGERGLFEARRAATNGQKSQLTERVAQLREEIRGLDAQVTSKRQQIALINQELEGVQKLYNQNLVPITRLTTLQREASRLHGEEGQLIAQIASSKGRIAETELQIIQLGQDLRREVATEQREVQAKIGEFTERKVTAEDQLKRIDIRAPQDGYVHQLAVHTIGGVINPGEPLMLIVPRADSLVVEARIAPHEIDQVRAGQPVQLRFSAFNSRTTPEIMGVLSRVSADLTREQQTNIAYYTARITIADEELKKLEDRVLLPGMPVEAFMQTGSRTALSYLVKPFEDQVMRAFRER
ncbi:MAG TPA: HlyD family type I secretion periplasmic adaptor subunit [Beijerinckiaceae bacterium]|nr:HlyD family type I secretion periplasmic adaptor subunit [Beijerinckiaceae bacterium]